MAADSTLPRRPRPPVAVPLGRPTTCPYEEATCLRLPKARLLARRPERPRQDRNKFLLRLVLRPSTRRLHEGQKASLTSSRPSNTSLKWPDPVEVAAAALGCDMGKRLSRVDIRRRHGLSNPTLGVGRRRAMRRRRP